jgi:hypothetical protein
MNAESVIKHFQKVKAAEERLALMDSAAQKAGRSFPQLERHAPNVTMKAFKHLPDVAGMYDDESKSVFINSAAKLNMNEDQLAGLISLERARGFLSSPLGRQFLDNFQMDDSQAQWWEGFYLPDSVDAPTDPSARQDILKSTILSRLLVGDEMPDGAPPLTENQRAVGDLFSSYAARRK